MQGGTSCLLSLFASKEDAMEVHGAVQWLIKAYEDYRHRVINDSIGYKVFKEENLVRLAMPIFLDEGATYSDLLQEATDRDKVKHILENQKFTEHHFARTSFTEDDAINMIGKYNAIGTKRDVKDDLCQEILPFAEYPQEVKEGLAKVFRDYKLLAPDITSEDLVLLLTTGKPSCQYIIPPYARNGDIGIIINILLTAGSLPRNAVSTICAPGMFLAATGATMKRRNLSAVIHKYDNYQRNQLDDKLKAIERDVMKVMEKLPNAKKNTKM